MEYFSYDIAKAIVPLVIVVVLPVMVVWLVTRWKINRDNKNAEIIKKAVESNSVQDVDKVIMGLRNASQDRSEKDIVLKNLLRGCMFTIGGVFLIIIGFVYWHDNEWVSDEVAGFWTTGAISIAIGVAYLIVYRVSSKMFETDGRHKD